MYTQTDLYYRTELNELHASIDRMEASGWSVRLTEILDPLYEVKKPMGPDTLPVTVKVLTILVVYEREHS